MLSASSPIAFPQSSPPAPKRAKPHDHGPPKPKARGPFVIDDDSDSDDEPVEILEHVSKRPMLEDPRESRTEKVTQPGTINLEDDDDVQALLEAQLQEPQISLPSWSSQRPLFSTSFLSTLAPKSYTARTCNGKAKAIKERKMTASAAYETMVAARSKTKEGRAKRAYYGIEIHELMTAARTDIAAQRAARPTGSTQSRLPIHPKASTMTTGKKPKRTLLWTEKYRARNFMDLCGDDGTNRTVLRWLKRWDPLVFPGAARARRRPGMKKEEEEEKPHRKILMLTGPPGLGKTTLAHVCARQAGYDVMEINASDDRSRDVVRNRIRTSLGTESVKNVTNRKEGDDGPRKVARPACVIVDEVDGVVGGSGPSGEGGFVKALIDLVLLDQKNSNSNSNNSSSGGAQSSTYARKNKGDDFRLMRPLILICNDVYHPALRPLRQSGLAEIVHVGKPTVEAVVARLKAVFEKEGIPCDKDAARKLCEAAWGMSSGIDARRGAESTVEGDLRGVMVVGEWVAARYRSTPPDGIGRLTRQWIERHVLDDLAKGSGGGRGLGRGGVRDIVSRLFQEGGGFPKQVMDLSSSLSKTTTAHEQPKAELGFGEQQKKYAMERLQHMIETSGEVSRVVTDVFAEYPNRDFNDDMYLTKPNLAYDWLHFHDACQARLFSSQDWELAPYLSQPALACHHLFASPRRHIPNNAGFDRRWGASADAEDDTPPDPFSGPRADYQANEALKLNRSQLQALQAQLPPTLGRSFRSAEDVAVEFLPYLVRLVSPDVKPVVVGGSSSGSTASVRKDTERAMVKRASEVLAEVGVELQRGKIEGESLVNRGVQYVYRMEPDLDALSTFETASSLLLPSAAPTRYAVRQVLDQELKLTLAAREARARQARFQAGNPLGGNGALFLAEKAKADKAAKNKAIADAAAAGAQDTVVKRDFFGRIVEVRPVEGAEGGLGAKRAEKEHKIYVTFHEGLNNAVRKPMSLGEFMKDL